MNNLSPAVLAELYGQESNDPFINLLTLSHPGFPSDILLAANSVDITSRGSTYSAFPISVILPVDDGETTREVTMEFDNVSRELVDSFRSVTDSISVKLEIVLASMPDEVQIEIAELKIYNIAYNATKISAKMYLDNFLNTEMTSERYTPSIFPGMF